MSMKFGPMVLCSFSGRETFTRVWDGTVFCGDCGSTEHETIKEGSCQ